MTPRILAVLIALAGIGNPVWAAAGDTLRLTAVVRDSTGTALTGRELTWSSSSSVVVAVSADGLRRSLGSSHKGWIERQSNQNRRRIEGERRADA